MEKLNDIEYIKALIIKETNYKIFLKEEWYQIDEDVFVKKDEDDDIFYLIGVYLSPESTSDEEPLFNLAMGSVDLNNKNEEDIKKALDTYDWNYDTENKQVIIYDETFDTEWSKYLIAEAIINHGNSDLEVLSNISFEEVLDNLKLDLADISK